MNILFQVGSWHYDKGGTDVFVKTLSFWLAKKGHKIIVLAHRLQTEECTDEDIQIGKGLIKVRYTPAYKRGKRFNVLSYSKRLVITSLYLFKLAKEEKADIAVVGETELISTLPLKLLNTKIICRGGALLYETMSQEILKERGKGLYSSIFIKLVKFYNLLTLKIPDAVVPVNNSEYYFLNLHKRRSAYIVTIPHGINTELFKLKKRGHPKKIIIGYIGRLAPIKHPETVLKIYKEASANFDNTDFYWIGPLDPSFSQNYFEDLKKILSIKHARYLGPIKNNKIPLYLNKLDIFLQAENQKNVSRSTTEAAACGLPIVALNIGKEPYGFFTSDESEAVAELHKLIKDKKYRLKKAMGARSGIIKNYSEDSIYNRYLGLFNKLK